MNTTVVAILLLVVAAAWLGALVDWLRDRWPFSTTADARPRESREEIVSRHLAQLPGGPAAAYRVRSKSFDEDTVACLRRVLEAEGQLKLAPPVGQRLSSWQARPDIPIGYIELSHQIERLVQARCEALAAEEKAAAAARLAALQNAAAAARAGKDAANAAVLKTIQTRCKDLIEIFLMVAERKVATLDEYGDANWDALEKELQRCVHKVAAREGAARGQVERLLQARALGLGRSAKASSAKRTAELLRWWRSRTEEHPGFYPTPAPEEWLLTKRYWLLADALEAEFRSRFERRAAGSAGTEDLDGMEGRQFETYVADLLKALGFTSVRGTPASGDQGGDLIAVWEGRTVVIQAKRYQRPVGNKAVQEVIAALGFYKGNEAWVVTNSTFTPAAVALAQSAKVRLVDGVELRRLVRKSRSAPRAGSV